MQPDNVDMCPPRQHSADDIMCNMVEINAVSNPPILQDAI